MMEIQHHVWATWVYIIASVTLTKGNGTLKDNFEKEVLKLNISIWDLIDHQTFDVGFDWFGKSGFRTPMFLQYFKVTGGWPCT